MRSAHERPDRLDFVSLQRWFIERVVGPHRTVGHPIPGPERAVADLIRPSKTLTAEQRIAIYSGLYLSRLREIISIDHPALEQLMGDEAFAALARDYLSRFPPNDYTLRSVCRAIPYYLEHHYHGDDKALLLDVARLERAVSDAFDTLEVPRVTAEVLAEVPGEAWPEVRFRMDPSFRALALGHDAPSILDAHHGGTELPDLGPRPTWAVVWRQGNKVWRQPVSEVVYTILAALASGEVVAVALERATEVWQGDEEQLAGLIFQWFASWMNEGYFHKLVLPAGQPPDS